MKTQSALAAAAIRKEIKAAFPGLKFSCTSDNYAGGSSVRVHFEDQPRQVRDAIEKITGKYQYGHFDGMNDIYEISNSRNDIPQAKFVFVENRMTDTMRQAVYDRIRKEWNGGDALPARYEDGRDINFQGEYISTFVWREFNRADVTPAAVAA